jgi:hypothetical protein
MTKRKVDQLENQVTVPLLKKTKVESEKVLESQEIFADPTYDTTFKMLFGTENNKDILISILNNFLDFKGVKEITDVQIVSSDLYSRRNNRYTRFCRCVMYHKKQPENSN